MAPEQIYTLEELAELIGKDVPFLRDLIRRGFLRCHQNCPGGRIHVTLTQWQAYLDGTETTGVGSDPSRGPRARTSQRVRRSSGKRTRRGSFNGKSRNDPTAYRGLELS